MKKTTLSKPWPVISLALLVALGGYIGCMTASGSDESVNARVIEPNVADASPTYFSYSTDEIIPLSGSTLTAHDALARPVPILRVGPYLAIGDNQVDPPIHIIRASDGAYVQAIGHAGEGVALHLTVIVAKMASMGDPGFEIV